MNRLLATSAALSLVATALADQPAGKPPVVPDATSSSPARRERASYIGIATAVASPAVRDQLSLPRGVGVIIEFVDPDSPAEKAGLLPFDVIHKFNDQIVVNAQQLTVLVRMQKAGETVQLSLIRRGQPKMVNVVLADKELPPIEESVSLVIPPQLRLGAPMPRVGGGRGSGMMTHSDAEHIITIVTHDNQRDLTIKDREGKVIYQGPLNNDDDRRRVPPALLEKIERIEQSTDRLRELRAPLEKPTREAEKPT